MAHQLATVNGKSSMAYFGEKPWHGLGIQLDGPATAEEAIAAAGLNYEVQLVPMTTTGGQAVQQRKATVRSDNGAVLGVVGKSYVPIQNREAFEFLDNVVSDGQLRYHTAGALGHGERIWMLAKLPGHIQVKRTDDITEKFLLLSNSHDGTSALRAFFTPIRVVCANTLSIAHQRGRSQGVSILHRGELRWKVQQAQAVLGLAHRFYEDVEVKVHWLASKSPTHEQVSGMFQSLFPDPAEGERSKSKQTREELFRLYEEGRGQEMEGVGHTAWAAYNAVTEYVDHHRPTRARNDVERTSRRLQSLWFGSGAVLKAKAWDLALAMAS
jgi:phage/plasmid-like protein (TIGR03299 family)